MQRLRRILRLGSGTPGPTSVAGVACALIAAIYTALVLAYVRRNSCFVGDDVTSMWLASRMPASEFLVAPIDVHFVPLHRAANWVLSRIADLRFSFGLGFLVAVHLSTLALLAALLRKLGTGVFGWFLLGAYAVQVMLGSMFMWWSSGLHRLPYVFFAVLSCYAYLRFRETGSWRAAALLCVAMLGALGFYSKGLLIPLYVGALHVALVGREPMRLRRAAGIATACALLAVTLSYLAAWKSHTANDMHSVTEDASFYAGFVRWGLQVFGPTWLGVFLDASAWMLGLTLAVALLACGFSTLLNQRAALAWGGLLLALAANFLLHAASAAKMSYGFGTLMADRYYFESAFLVVVFVGAAYADVEARELPGALANRAVRWGAAILGVGLLAVVATRSYRTFQRIATVSYPTHRVAHDYMENLRASFDALPAPDQQGLTLVDGPMPAAIVPSGTRILRRQSDLLRLMDLPVRYSKRARFRISTDGRIVRR